MSDRFFMLRQARCGRRQKKKLVPTIAALLLCHDLARVSGIVAIERMRTASAPWLDLLSDKPPFRTGLELVLDGAAPALVERILDNFLGRCGFTGRRLLEAIMIRDAVLSIRQGNSSQLFAELLSSLLGEGAGVIIARARDMAARLAHETAKLSRINDAGTPKSGDTFDASSLPADSANTAIEETAWDWIAAKNSAGRSLPYGLPSSALVPLIADAPDAALACFLSLLDRTEAGAVFRLFPAPRRADIIAALLALPQVVPAAVRKEAARLQLNCIKLASEAIVAAYGDNAPRAKAGVEIAADLLRPGPASDVERIVAALEKSDANGATDLRHELYRIDDLVALDDLVIQRLVRETGKSVLPKALKAASIAVRDRIYDNVPKKTAEWIAAEIEALGPVRIEEIDAAREAVIRVLRRLEESGEILVAGPGSRGFIV